MPAALSLKPKKGNHLFPTASPELAFLLEVRHGRAPPRKVAAHRGEWKQKLRDRMRESIKEQGSFGIRQTAIWLKAYKRAKAASSRENSTVATMRKRIQALDGCLNWETTT